MLSTFTTIIRNQGSRAEARIIDDDILASLEAKLERGAQNYGSAKRDLACLVVRQRSAQHAIHALKTRICDVKRRLGDALTAGDMATAHSLSDLLAHLEREQEERNETLAGMMVRSERLRSGLDTAMERLNELGAGLEIFRQIDRAQPRVSRRYVAEEGRALLRRVQEMMDLAEAPDPLDVLLASSTTRGRGDEARGAVATQ